eukprot:jgi/Psemu1/328662/estExt_fgenesh1_pg.C_18750001
MATVKSGIQKEVLALYRALLRQAARKDRMALAAAGHNDNNKNGGTGTVSFSGLLLGSHGNDPNTTTTTSTGTSTSHARAEFRRQAAMMSRKDFRGIEHKIRYGYKQIKLLQMPGVVTVRSW